MMRGLIYVSLLLALCCACQQPFAVDEQKIIGTAKDGMMRLYSIAETDDSLFLRKKSQLLEDHEIKSDLLQVLKRRMILTVNDTTNPGVGIAAPQVGISRCLVAVQRFDKAGEPFEFYINPEIIYYSDMRIAGPEGCLSVPDIRDTVWRSQEIVVRYIDADQENVGLIAQTDTVRGFTAVIFQHEIDHLDGILFIDCSGTNK